MTEIKRRWALYVHTDVGGDPEPKFEALHAWANRLGAEILYELWDHADDRHGRDAALELLADDCVEAVAVYSLSDLGRTLRELDTCFRSASESFGTILIMVENMDLSDPQARFLLNVMSAFAFWEEQHLAEQQAEE